MRRYNSQRRYSTGLCRHRLFAYDYSKYRTLKYDDRTYDADSDIRDRIINRKIMSYKRQ